MYFRSEMKKIFTIITFFFLFFNLLIMFSIQANSEKTNNKKLFLGGTGEGNYSSIQDAINNATNGSIIYVYSGEYYGSIFINKSISLIGNNSEDTIISGIWEVIKINADHVSISGFKIILIHGTISGINHTYSGIELIDSENCFITNNKISANNGIYISNSNNNSIINNSILNCSVYGIKLSQDCKNNIIYHNNLINNSHSAYDMGNNHWYNTDLKQGNYWDNYTGCDKNNDGIGDSSFIIFGGENKDEYPLVNPYFGKVILNEFYVNYDDIYRMLVIGLVVAIIFCLPIAYIWYRKYYLKK